MNPKNPSYINIINKGDFEIQNTGEVIIFSLRFEESKEIIVLDIKTLEEVRKILNRTADES